VLRRPEPALHHARRVLEICATNGIGDWDRAFAYEALARASALAGDDVAARAALESAQAQDVADADDRELLERDLATIPGLFPAS
jgi:hypothetical protein